MKPPVRTDWLDAIRADAAPPVTDFRATLTHRALDLPETANGGDPWFAAADGIDADAVIARAWAALARPEAADARD